VLEAFPDLLLNLAHVGRGDYLEEIAELCHRFPNFYTDLSHRLNEVEDPASPMTSESMAALIRKCGADKVLFGTNYPAVSPVQFARVLRGLPLTGAEIEAVANGNAKRMLRLD
jgi:predicted TIM-barrel fold metal-dependent hydrolase